VVAVAQRVVDTSGCGLDVILEELPFERLRKRERVDLRYMREEEKLARDVYLSLAERWDLRVFRQIARSERSHMASALVLIEKYGLADPVGDNPLGVFTDSDLQALYEDLSKAGQRSRMSALTVGAAIEELDIVDLQRALARTNNRDLRLLYENLMKGSRNHLRSFVATLERQGGRYEPALLDLEEYREIVDSPTERGIVGFDGDLPCGR
jgi:hypothetical protein